MKECSTCKYCFPDDFQNCPSDGQRLKVSIQGDTVLDGRYQLDRRLGHGGMGIVFEGRHVFLKTTFAIKVILPDLVGNDPMLVTRFRQEAMVAARMRHPNLVNVTDFGVVHGMPYLVMELIVGRSLHELLLIEGRLSPHQSVQIIAAVCAGVGAAHRQGVVHRDLKPLNIMLMNDVPFREGVKVLDFGLAKIKSGELLGSFVAAQTTGLMGSPAYMAPELWSDDEPDARADVYSMGIILFQMLSGEVPFRGATIPSIMKKHLTQPPPSFAEQGVIVPPAIEAVVRRALAKARDDRHPSVESFAEEFRNAVGSMESTFDQTLPDLGIAIDTRTMPLPVATSEQTLAERQRRIEDEAEKLAREFEEAQQRADEARQRAEDAAQRKAEEEAARKRAEEEAARKLAEEEEARRRAEETAKRQAAEEAARREAEEATERERLALEARKRAEAEEARKLAAEESARLAKEIAEVQQRAEEARLRADEEARWRTKEVAARKRAEEEARKLTLEVAETKRRAEEARSHAEEEARIKAQVEAARRKHEEEEDRQRAEKETRQRKVEEEARTRAASEADRLSREVAQAQQRAEDAGKRAEAEAQRRATEEAARRKAEEEARRLALEVEEAQRRVEEARKRVEEARRESEAERADLARRRKDYESASTIVQPGPQQTPGATPDIGQLTQASIPQRMDAPGFTPSSADVPAPSLSQREQFQTMKVASQIQQSHPSLQGSIHTQPFSSIPDLVPAPAKQSRALAMVIGGLVLLIIVGVGGGLGIYFWRASATKSADHAVTPPNPNGNVTAPPMTPAKAEMVKIEGGTLQMGRNDIDINSTKSYELNQFPAHQISVGSFFMDRTEVTNAEYLDFVGQTSRQPPTYWRNGKPPAGQEQWPVTNVSLADAEAFAQWRSKRDNLKYELPTEEQWEYAARNGSTGNLYPWGNEWCDNCANVDSNALTAVGSYPKGNSLNGGIADLIGNAWEWTATKASPYPGADRLPRTLNQQGQIIRGGSYRETFKGSDAITATRRVGVPPSDKQADIGFRLIRTQ
ncbi:MAG: SUMF1/EgtB/PvdO family nonheme iron enzyme [Acidobacteriota bacterium]